MPRYHGANSANRPSPIIFGEVWNRSFPMGGGNPMDYIGFFEDFVGFNHYVVSNVGAHSGKSGGWNGYEDTSVTLAPSDTFGGRLSYTGTTSDNLEASIQYGDANSAPFQIGDTVGSQYKLFFECRFEATTVANTQKGAFMGLAEQGSAANSWMADDGNDFADQALIGFWLDEDDGDNIKFVYKADGGALTTAVAAVTSLSAATAVNLGFVFDPKASTDKRITIYVNGAPISTYVTGANIAAATFPDDERMSPILSVKQATNASHPVHWDWVACYQATEAAA